LKLKIINYPVSQVLIDSPNYPQRLKQLSRPPNRLYYRGVWQETLFSKTLAIVGSRRATNYSERVLDLLLPSLIAEGVTIISGFMYGVDTLAHQKCLENGGRTIAVLGGGLNVLYPPENEKLYQEIIQNGLIISEYPPDQQPQLWTFIQRNRLVAALSTLGVLVVEAGEKSGSLVTAKLARELGKPVLAIPGPITSSVSQGTNELIRRGWAKPVLEASDILPLSSVSLSSEKSSNPHSPEGQILTWLAAEPLTLDELALKLNQPVAKVSQILILMALKNEITEENGQYFPKTTPIASKIIEK